MEGLYDNAPTLSAFKFGKAFSYTSSALDTTSDIAVGSKIRIIEQEALCKLQ